MASISIVSMPWMRVMTSSMSITLATPPWSAGSIRGKKTLAGSGRWRSWISEFGSISIATALMQQTLLRLSWS
ncbi:MAG TPA: hypothetical protein PKJ93_05940 [Methanoculleus sp.]|nr:hypothetical protein [Methanoculleus sp.]